MTLTVKDEDSNVPRQCVPFKVGLVLTVVVLLVACAPTESHTLTAPPPSVVDLALVTLTKATHPSQTTTEIWGEQYEVEDRHAFRLLSADIEPVPDVGSALRVTLEPHAAAQAGEWTVHHVGRYVGLFIEGRLAEVMLIDGRSADSFRIMDPQHASEQLVREIVARVGATRDVPLATEYAPTSSVESWIELERTPCSEQCPAYSVRVHGDGSIAYTGRSGVAQIGERQAVMSADATRRLFLRFGAADFFVLPEHELTTLADASATIVTLHVNGRTKRALQRVHPDTAGSNGADGLVDVLARAIDLETRSRQWIGTYDVNPRARVGRDAAYGPRDWNALEISLQRSGCYGTCPAYQIVIRGDGSVSYTGSAYVAVKGSTSTSISRDAIEHILDQIQAADFWQLDERYDYQVTDIASTTLALRIDGREKTVVNRWIDWPRHADIPDVEMHRTLDAIAASIDAAVDSEAWVGPREVWRGK